LDKKELIINVESHPHEDLEPGIFMNSLTLWDEAFFSTLWLISLEKLIGSSRKFCHRGIFGQGKSRTSNAAPCWRVVPYWRDRRWRRRRSCSQTKRPC